MKKKNSTALCHPHKLHHKPQFIVQVIEAIIPFSIFPIKINF